MTSIASYAARVFFDRQKLDKRLSKSRRKVLTRTGALVRTIARRSIKKPKRGWTPESRKRYQAARRRWRRMKKRGSQVPAPNPKEFSRSIPSAPGTPPKDKTGVLKRTIFFGYDAMKNSVVIGPIKFGSGTAKLLEYGGKATLRGYRKRRMHMAYKARPFMRPARRDAGPKAHKFYKNIL